MITLVLSAELRAQIAHEARAAFPNECCGLIEGVVQGDTIAAHALHPARNLASAADRFEIDPADHFAALRTARAASREIVGCYHSHPNGRAEPSSYDAAGATETGFLWLIAALAADGPATLKAFVFNGKGFVPASLDSARGARV